MGILVVKIGGSTLGAHDTTLEDVVALHHQGTAVVVVHGGGPQVTSWLKVHGAGTTFVRGLRVTDAAALDVVVAVLGGLVNKQLTAAINALGGRAVGLSGADGPTILAKVQEPELGRVGEVCEVRPDVLMRLLDGAYMPVLSSVGIEAGGSTEGSTLLNINADPVAGAVAAALGAERLVFLTDVPGVKDGDGVLRSHLSAEEVAAMIAAGTIGGGMIPKVEACLHAAREGVRSMIIDGREPHALLAAMQAAETGTTIG